MQRAYRYRLYPTDEQMQQMVRIIGCCRFTYNRLLEYCSKSYKRRKESHTSFDLNIFIGHTLKKAYPWLSDAPAQTLQCVSADLSSAFKAFFRGDARYPRYKSKHHSKKSFRVPQKCEVDEGGGRIRLQRLGWVKAVIHRSPIGKLKHITVTVNPSGTVYASCLYDDGTDPPKPIIPAEPKVLGTDLNLDRLAVCSDGTDYMNPRALRKHEKRLKHLQRMLSKKRKGSENWRKLKREIASLHEKIANIRKDRIHRMTKRIVCDSQADAIAIEDLNVSGMMKNDKLSKHMQDASFWEIRRQLEYKCLWYGKTLVIADRSFASSRICHRCGWHNDNLTLRDREWECPICHTRHDRDRNAALNLESFGLKALARDAGEVKPPEMPNVDESRVCTCIRSKASVNEEKELGISQEASGLAQMV